MKLTHQEAFQNIVTIVKRTVFGKQKFESGKLADGTVIEYSKLEVGGEISIKDASDTLVPAPIGEHELEDGTVIVVTEIGIIAEIKPAPTAEEAAAKAAKKDAKKEGEEAPAKLAEEAPAAKGGLDWSVQIEDLKRSLAWQAERVASLVTAMEMFKADTAEVVAAFQAYVEIDSATGSGPITKPRQTVFGDAKKTQAEGAERAIAAFKAFNQKLAKDKKKK